jgi:uncharacterized protein (DUF1015 family)
MADVRPFCGLRFDPRRVEVGRVFCPPFDVISPDEQRALHERDPHNVVRIELGLGSTDPGAAGNRYASASEALAAWQQEGVLTRDAEPAFYLYENHFHSGERQLTRRCLFVAGRLHDWSEGAVLPHEGTRAGPKQDRLALLRATHTSVSPLWLVYDDADAAVRTAIATGWQADPLIDLTSDGQRHTLRRLDDRTAMRAVVAAFASRPLFIADGHHRYETAQFYRDERRRSVPVPDTDAGYEFALMMLEALDDPGLVVLATHRLVRRLSKPPAAIRDALARWFTVERLPLPDGDDALIGTVLERTLANARRTGTVLGLLDAGGGWLLRLRTDGEWQSKLPAGHTPAWKTLDVSVLDALAIRDVCGISAEGESARADATSHAPSDRLTYVSDFAGAVRAVQSGEAEQAFLLNPTPVEQVCAVAAAGDRMPPKSTFFFPKPPTGLVMHPLDGRRPAP